MVGNCFEDSEKKDMPLEGFRWSRDSGSALYDTPQTAVSRTGWG